MWKKCIFLFQCFAPKLSERILILIQPKWVCIGVVGEAFACSASLVVHLPPARCSLSWGIDAGTLLLLPGLPSITEILCQEKCGVLCSQWLSSCHFHVSTGIPEFAAQKGVIPLCAENCVLNARTITAWNNTSQESCLLLLRCESILKSFLKFHFYERLEVPLASLLGKIIKRCY